MIILSLRGPSLKALRKEILSLTAWQRKKIDLYELRLDLFPWQEQELKAFCRSFPSLLTLRSQEHGGASSLSADKRLSCLKRLFTIDPLYLDLEYPHDQNFLLTLSKKDKQQILLSNHKSSLQGYDKDLKAMKALSPSLCKIIIPAQKELDNLELLTKLSRNDIAFCSGPLSHLSRLLAHLFGAAVFLSLPGQSTAPHQLSLDALETIVKLSSRTKLLCLAGTPLGGSPSHRSHQKLLDRWKQDALYLPIEVSKEDFLSFKKFICKLSFWGASLTMPLKKLAAEHADSCSAAVEESSVANSWLIKNDYIYADNTDRVALLSCLEKPLKKILSRVNKARIFILGSGAMAQMSAQILKIHSPLIFARRTEKHFPALSFDKLPQEMKKGCDLLIHCTSVGMRGEKPLLLAQDLSSSTHLLDFISQPMGRTLIEEAQEAGASYTKGMKIFCRQAAEQFALWLPSLDKQKILMDLEELLC